MGGIQRGNTKPTDSDSGTEPGIIEARREQPPGSTRDGQPNDYAIGDGRGRAAERPSDIPAVGWKDILWRVYEGIFEDRIFANAAAVAFYGLLALFPGIAALVSIYGLFADPATIQQHLDSISVLPGGAIDVIRDQLTRLAAEPRSTLGTSFLVTFLISLWSANGGIKALFDALNVVYEEREKRSFIKLNAITLAFTLAMVAFVIVALACIVAVPVALSYLPGFVGSILNIARWPLMLVLITVALSYTDMARAGTSRNGDGSHGGVHLLQSLGWLFRLSSRSMLLISAVSIRLTGRSAELSAS
jgi:membrane protein